VQEDIVFRNQRNDGFVIVVSSVLNQISRYRQTLANDQEAGGILLGARRGRHIEITFATTPKRGDKRGRTDFHRISPFHQSFARRAWKRFDRKLDYIGEWHTHPEHNPSPSHIDIAEWRKLLRKRKTELVFMILGISGLWLGVSSANIVVALPEFR
jgi:integrative and conjugative element protein (TIGR02256 family)